METQSFRKVMCANRGEIAIRVFRACNELGLRTVAIFSEEDATHQHRYKADESYLVGRGRKPVDAYLAIADILEATSKSTVLSARPKLPMPMPSTRATGSCPRTPASPTSAGAATSRSSARRAT
ncbi:MAG: hypothetical protein O3B85_14310 [Planctomycetota bacterium]|nr:hypothetical protein [Planctomycetota bacterium]